MKCYKCKKDIRCIRDNFIKKYGNKTIIIENTPTYICDNCYEEFYNEKTIENIENIMEKLEKQPFKLIVIDYNEIVR